MKRRTWEDSNGRVQTEVKLTLEDILRRFVLPLNAELTVTAADIGNAKGAEVIEDLTNDSVITVTWERF